MTSADFRRIALSLDGAAEGSHMGHADFRVGGRIFATLAAVKQGYGNLMLTPRCRPTSLPNWPNVFIPMAGGWGRNGATHVRLSEVNKDVLTGALRPAWRLRLDQNAQASKKARAKKPRVKA